VRVFFFSFFFFFFFVLVKSLSLVFFSRFCGLRQWDPLSPLLFVIVIEALGKMIYVAVSGGLLSGFFGGDWRRCF
jgi:hypothetical protein